LEGSDDGLNDGSVDLQAERGVVSKAVGSTLGRNIGISDGAVLGLKLGTLEESDDGLNDGSLDG